MKKGIKMTKKKETKTCGQCFYCEDCGKPGVDIGECFRYPPSNDGTGQKHTDVGGIVKKDRRACGEYK